jgi:recombination protein RecT
MAVKPKNESKWKPILQEVELEFTELASVDNHIVNFQREAAFAIETLDKNADHFRNISADSVCKAFLKVALVGISLNKNLEFAYLLPRRGECCLDVGYKGILKTATDTGSILGGKPEIVRANDGILYRGPFEYPFYPDTFDPFAPIAIRGELKGCLTIAKLHNGTYMVDPISGEEITKIRALSKAKTGPWFDWEDEMVKKTGIRRAAKYWPRTDRLGRLEGVLNETQGLEMEFGANATIQPPQTSRQSAAEIAAATQVVQPSIKGDQLIAQLEDIAKSKGANTFADVWRAMSKEDRSLVGKNNRDRIFAMAQEPSYA